MLGVGRHTKFCSYLEQAGWGRDSASLVLHHRVLNMLVTTNVKNQLALNSPFSFL